MRSLPPTCAKSSASRARFNILNPPLRKAWSIVSPQFTTIFKTDSDEDYVDCPMFRWPDVSVGRHGDGADRRFAAARDTDNDARQHKQDGGPETRRRQKQIIARPAAMAFLAARHLGGEVIAQRLFEKHPLALNGNGNQPGQDQKQYYVVVNFFYILQILADLQTMIQAP